MVVEAPRSTAEAKVTSVVRLIVIWLVSLAVTGLVIGLFYRVRVTGPTDEAMDYGQIAYNMSKGRGFVTNNIVPFGLYFWKDVRKAYDLEHGPLYPFFLALLIGFRGTQDSTLILGSILWFVLSLILVYFVGSRLFSARVGFWAAALLLFAEVSLAALATSGLPAAMAGFLLLAACYLLYRPSYEETDADTGQVVEAWSERRPRRSFWAGVVAGLAYLTQISLWLLLLPATVYLLVTNPERRARHVALFLLGFVLISLPYWVRNARLFGNPFFNLRVYEVAMATKPYPGYSLYRSYEEGKRPPSVTALFLENAQQIVGKWTRNMRNGIGTLLTFPHPIPMALAFAGLFLPLRRRSLALWRNMVWWTAALVLVGCSFGVPGANVLALYCFAFVFSILAIGSLEDLLQALSENAVRAWRWAISGVALVLLVPLLLSFVFREPKEVREELVAFNVLSQRLDRVVSELKQRGTNQFPMPAVGISDVPWRAAWYTHHIWVWLPETPLVQVPVELGQGQNKLTVNQQVANMAATRQVLEKVEPVFVLLTPNVGGPPDGERLRGWVDHYNQAAQFVFQSYFVTERRQMQQLAQAWKARRRAPYDPVTGGFYPVPEVSPARVVERLEQPRWLLFILSP
ncbi:MAG: glycosyltransferase family 39 protein [Armatimonadetes bacterium]|nr:glycosyltransferase family 39 protein [Armatimonadota bacterium]